MKRNEQLFAPSVKRIIYGSTFLLGLSMSNIIDMPGISPEIVYGETLIPNVTATASSYVAPYGPERAVDSGSGSDYGYSRWYCTGSDKSLVLDLKQSYKIDKWVVQNLGVLGWDSSANAKGYRLLGSMDKNQWTVIDTVTNNTQDFTDRSIAAPVLARYVKLEVTEGNQNNNYWTSIVDFKVYAAPASISSVSVPANGTYVVGQTLNFTVNFDGKVNLYGANSSLSLDVGGQIKQAAYVSKTPNSITYRYTVQSGDLDKDGIVIGTLNLNGDILFDSLNNAIDPTLKNVGNTSGIIVESLYKINISSITGGTISTSPAGEAVGDGTVIVTVTPDSKMRLKENTLKYNDGSDYPITGSTFTMPNKDVTISAEFEKIPLTITSDLADGTTIKSGKNVILTAEDGAKIYYTVGTDLSEPADPTTATSFILSGESISITGASGETVKVKAYAEKAGVPDSQIVTFTYKIKEKQSLEVKGLSVANKVYDGTTSAIIQGTDTAALDSAGILSGFEDVSLSGSPSGAFNDKNAGNGKAVTVTGYTLTGVDADCYELKYPTLNADITPKDITVSGITAKNKNYDGTKKAELDISSANLSILAGGDSPDIDLSTATIEFEDASEGTGKKVNVSRIKLTGEAKDNYNLTNSSLTLTADILGVAVIPEVKSVKMPNPWIELNNWDVTGSLQFSATVDVVGGASKELIWSCSDTTNKVTVDEKTGVLTIAPDALLGEYTITATSKFDTSIKDTMKLIIKSLEGKAVNSVQVTPASVTIEQGGSRQMTATVDAVGGTENGVDWSSNDGTGKVTVTSKGIVNVAADAAVGDYIITAASKFDGNKAGTAVVSVKSSVTPPVEPPVNPPTPPVNPPVPQVEPPTPDKPGNNTEIKIVKQPSKETVRKGNTASFSIKVEGTEPFSYQWQKDGEALYDDDNISGANKSRLKIENAQKSDAGEYSCIVADGFGNVTTSSAVTLRVTSRTTNNNDSSTTNTTNNSSSQGSNNSDTTTININGEEAALTKNLEKLANDIKSENVNTIIVDVTQTNAGNGVPQNETNAAGGTNPPLLGEEVLTILKSNTNKTLIIKNGDSSIQVKGNSQGEIQFTQNNTPVAGFVTVGNSEYYSNENGIMKTGWIQTAENVYYHFNTETGIKEKGWVKDVSETWYYLDKTSGIMKTGWLNDNGISYYLKSTGAMATGWLQDSDGKWYYFYQNGAMAKNATIDGYYVDENGVWM